MWVVDSAPVDCVRSREAAHRSEARRLGRAQLLSQPHTCYFWGPRLHLLPTPTLSADRSGQTVIADRHDYGRQFEATLTDHEIRLLRPARPGKAPRPGARLFKPLRQVIEPINDTFKGELDIERHGGLTLRGKWVRLQQRVLALTAVISPNDYVGAPTHDH